ncbi:methyl-accepting chemotaxis protein [Cryptosporangium minutisporangium]|uniref:Methyl-accepting transducer domain-containing protein n=1 Tax=Cryptosporangium minutisporangium TaxID=113569 RepID=A0ABP6T020_9ACTN
MLDALRSSLRAVDDVAHIISGAARQTNLLALNATIEASRAGQAGAGFAVVANEVKTLAGNTADSSASITETLGQLNRDTTAVVGAIQTVSESISGIDTTISDVRAVTAAQQATLDEVIRRLNDATAQVTASTTGQ